MGAWTEYHTRRRLADRSNHSRLLNPGVRGTLADVADPSAVLADLDAEGADLESIVSTIPAASWALPTPASGWDIARQIAHLTWTDEVSTVAVTDPDAFAVLLGDALADPAGYVDKAAAEVARTPPADLLVRWQAGRGALAAALAAAADGTKLPWFGPPMSATSMATARLMETWAHGQDIADALGLTRTPTTRLRNIAHIGVRTRNFAFVSNNRPAPIDEFRVELIGPDGDTWTWGPDGAAQRVSGPALDFCLLVTQRRHIDDLALHTVGAEAAAWLEIAQAFAGSPGTGRLPGQFGDGQFGVGR